MGWHINRPGLHGPEGAASDTVKQAKALFDAAGECIGMAVNASPSAHSCAKLAERWLNAAHWFGRACVADADFVAIVMLIISLDVLSGGLEERGILELVARLTNTGMSDVVLPDSTKLSQLVAKGYGLRSEVAHGSILAVHRDLKDERYTIESLASIAIANYAVELSTYAAKGGTDDRDAFRSSLPTAKP